MKAIVYLIVSVAFCLLTVGCVVAGWDVFIFTHFLAMDATCDVREMRGDGPQPAFWRDHIGSLPFYIPALVIGLFAAMCGYFCIVSGWLYYRSFRRVI